MYVYIHIYIKIYFKYIGSKIISHEPKQHWKLAFNGGNHLRTLGSLVPTQNISNWLSILINQILKYTLVDMIIYTYTHHDSTV